MLPEIVEKTWQTKKILRAFLRKLCLCCNTWRRVFPFLPHFPLQFDKKFRGNCQAYWIMQFHEKCFVVAIGTRETKYRKHTKFCKFGCYELKHVTNNVHFRLELAVYGCRITSNKLVMVNHGEMAIVCYSTSTLQCVDCVYHLSSGFGIENVIKWEGWESEKGIIELEATQIPTDCPQTTDFCAIFVLMLLLFSNCFWNSRFNATENPYEMDFWECHTGMCADTNNANWNCLQLSYFWLVQWNMSVGSWASISCT